MSEQATLCTNCNKRPRASRLPWCRPCLDSHSRRSREQRRAIGKAHRQALREYQRPLEPRSGGRGTR